jgi:hypothetical protein
VARPSPEAVNIPILSVNGDSSFGPLIEYLDMFGIPWAAVVDGPALRPTSHLAKQMRKLDHQPSANHDDDFKGWQEYWAREGIFTLADRFGDDGSKGGEFEAFLRSTDSDRLCQDPQGDRPAEQTTSGCTICRRAPPPDQVNELYRHIWARWDLPMDETVRAPGGR